MELSVTALLKLILLFPKYWLKYYNVGLNFWTMNLYWSRKMFLKLLALGQALVAFASQDFLVHCIGQCLIIFSRRIFWFVYLQIPSIWHPWECNIELSMRKEILLYNRYAHFYMLTGWCIRLVVCNNKKFPFKALFFSSWISFKTCPGHESDSKTPIRWVHFSSKE